MFTGWNFRSQGCKVDELARSFVRRQACRLRYDQALFQVDSVTFLGIDEWTSNLLLSADSSSLTLTNLDNSSLVQSSMGISKGVQDAAFYPFDSRLFATCNHGEVRLWDTCTLKPVRRFKLHTPRCNQLAFSVLPTSDAAGLIAVTTSQGQVRLVHLLTGSAAHTLSSDSDSDLVCVCWSPRDDYLLLTGDVNSRILLWDVRKPNACLYSLDELNQESSHPRQIEREESLREDPKRVRQGINGLHSRRLRNVFAHQGSTVTSLRFVHGGQGLLSTASNGTVHLWKQTSNMSTTYFENTLIEFPRVSPQKGGLGYHTCYSCEANLLYMANGARDNVISCIEPTTGELVYELSMHLNKVQCIAYREQHQELYSASGDGFVLKWTSRARSDDEISEQIDNEDAWSTV